MIALETLHLRLALSEFALLQDYLDGKPPSFETTRFHLMAAERRYDWRKPDHYHESSQNLNLGKIYSINDLLLKGISKLADNFLYSTGGRFYVKADRFEAWQVLIAGMSPLILIAYAIFARYGAPKSNRQDILDYVALYLRGQVGISALPTVREPAVEELIQQEGLVDLHVHLNGSTEMDTVWLQSLVERRQFVKELSKSFSDQGDAIRQLYKQIEPGLNPAKVGDRLRVARRLRIALWDKLSQRKGTGVFSQLTALADLNQLSLLEFDNGQRLDQHPVRQQFKLPESVSEMECEVVWITSALNELQQCPSEDFAGAMHCYFLIQGATFIPLCVQQREQFGFDQFQKVTVDGARERVEEQYFVRFIQAAYRDEISDLLVLEGRFSPKEKIAANAALLVRTLAGFTQFQNSRHKDCPFTEHSSFPLADVLGSSAPVVLHDRLDLRLVAHFIKRDELKKFIDKCEATDSEPLDSCRFYKLRCSLRKSARSLVFLRERFPRLKHYLTGIDAAANELHTPPEVFAPTFRYARRNGLRRATFHVGEDFHHLLSGIRAIWEAVDFLDLGNGDRIGHGVAIGIDPLVWSRSMPINMPMPQGEWLDNLIFIRHMLLGDLEASVLLPGIEEEIRRLVRAVYGDELQSAHIFSDLWEAWQLRCRDPLLRLDPDLDDRLLLDEEDFAEANRIKNIRPSKAAHRFDHSYHEAAVIRRWFQTVVIETLGLVPAVWLRRLQDQTINHLNKSGVAIETMLTSNVLISCYENYSEHHILRWLGLRGDGPRPIVCVASDNPGIFVTNMRNEFMHLHRILIEEGLSREEAVARLQVLNRNGRTYAFLTSD